METDSRRVLAVLAGRDVAPTVLAKWANSADVVLAADGAADQLLEAGVVPQVTIGDLDSLVRRHRLPRVIEDCDQSTSDADKVLGFAESQGYGAVTLIGVEGDRLDHVMASLASAARSRLYVRLVLRSGLGWVLRCGCSVEIACEVGDTISLLPIETCEGIVFSGVKWPLQDAEMSSTGLLSLSNRATASKVFASVRNGAAILIHLRDSAHPCW